MPRPMPTEATAPVRFTYDRWHGWWHLARHGVAPQFPFGFGLSYTEFAPGPVRLEGAPNGWTVRGTVRNTGSVDGADVVQVYARYLDDDDAPDRLVGFARVEVAAGTETGFEITIGADRLHQRDPVAHAWRAPAGRVEFVVGRRWADRPRRTAR